MDLRNAFRFSLIILILLPTAGASFALGIPDRSGDPVVLTGLDLPALLGAQPGSIVAFRYEGVWTQIPVQVDERAWVDFAAVYNEPPIGITTLSYTDTSTFVGADPNALFDEDDELVFMARDAGSQVPSITSDPANTTPFTRTEVKITDPLNGNEAYVYLFVSDGSLSQGAGADYVTYDFNLLSGPYKTTYNTTSGPNPENSTVTTSFYRTHFGDRWIRDEINIYAQSSSGVDILDRHKGLFAPGNCGRSENTFSAGEGAFFANIDGPVRAIRSYLGANSGPFTQREHVFYEDRHDIRTYLRVHAISGIMDFYDYSPDAIGMFYYNDLNPSGVLIDGSPDVVTSGMISWEMVSGSQGTLINCLLYSTDIPGFSYTSYYSDDSAPSTTQCTGDPFEYGASGSWIDQPIPNTDPNMTPYNNLTGTRIVYYEGPSASTSLAALRNEQANAPLTVSATPTGLSGDTKPLRPAILHNVPNPFASGTTISFQAPPGSGVALEIYDVQGNLVRRLFSGVAGDGAAEIYWNRKNRRGSLVPAGVYFCRLKTGNSSLSRKLVVID